MMSSRRAELFESTPRLQKNENSAPNNIIMSTQEETQPDLKSNYGMNPEEQDPLQLEHMLGYAGDFRKTVQCVPYDDNCFIKCMGSLVSLENLNDPHDQKLFRGHDNQITSLAVSSGGNFIATGQMGTKSHRGNAAPVLLWSLKSQHKIHALKGLTRKVNLISFSTDERFVCGCDEDSLCLIWEVATGEVVYGQRLGTSASVLMFVRHKPNKQYVSYELIIGIGSTLHKGLFFYDPYKVQWSLQLDSMIVPGGGGLVRNYTCVEVSPDPDALYLYAGTMGGEMLVFRRDSSVLRAVIPVCSNGLHCILVLPDGMIVTGGGDGKLQVLSGNDVSWSIVQQTILDSCILSLSLSANLNEVLTGCSSGNLYRCNLSDLSKLNVGVGHTSPVLCLAFQTTGTLFVTGTSDGVLRLWDVIDYACQSILRVPTAGSVFCIAISEVQHGHNSCVISGWEDGFIRCHDIDNLSKQLWLIPNAHRGGVTTLAVHVSNDPKALSYIISGGRDGVVRVWRYNNREFLFEYSDHSKSVAKVLIDIHKNHIIHSVGEDSSILSFDLKSRKRIISHLCPVQSISGISRSNSNSNIKDGKRDSRVLSGILNMTQRKDSEQELITCDGIGRLYHWDIDYRDPVLCLQDPSRSALYCCEVSPSGRYLAYSGVDQILKVLDLRRGRMVALGLAHSGAIMTVSWTADEKQIITGGDDFCLCIWNFFLTADDAIT